MLALTQAEQQRLAAAQRHKRSCTETRAHLWRRAEAEGLGDGQQIQTVHVEDALQLMAVVSQNVCPAGRQQADTQGIGLSKSLLLECTVMSC